MKKALERRVMVVCGTRPEAIKLAPLILECRRRGWSDIHLCNTAQHVDLVLPILRFFGCHPDYALDPSVAGSGLSDVAARVLLGVAQLLTRSRYELVVVQGDTTTALAAALAAFYEGVAVAHVEAGLRTHNLSSPFPEEGNRKAIDTLARFRFAPTERARVNLLNEGCADRTIFVTGNTGVDAVLRARDQLRSRPLPPRIERTPGGRLVLVTMHRRESFGRPLADICRAVRELVARYPALDAVVPVHPNPAVGAAIRTELGHVPRVHLTEPLDYPAFVTMMVEADLILTDSGGVQEEAPSLGKPLLVLRDHTERTEGLDCGSAELVGTDSERIVTAAGKWLEQNRPVLATPIYGDGRASERIASILETAMLVGFPA